MKRALAIICIFVLCFSICACGKTQSSEIALPEGSISEINSNSKIESDSQPDYRLPEKCENWRQIYKSNEYGRIDLFMEYVDSYSAMEKYNPSSTIGVLYGKPINTDPDMIPDENTEGNISINGNTLLMPYVNNTVPLDRLVSECNGRQVTRNLHAARFLRTESADFPTSYPNSYGNITTFLRQNDNGVLYTVRKLTYGGYLYQFYSLLPFSIYSNDKMDKYYPMGGIYMENIQSYSDFSNLKIGDGIDEVEKIDSAVAMWRLTYKLWSTSESDIKIFGEKYLIENISTLHLLTDGLLEIRYELVGEKYIITDIIYSEDFTYKSDYLYDKYGRDIEKSFKILPQDYPPAS